MSKHSATSKVNRRGFLEAAGTVTAVSVLCSATSGTAQPVPPPGVTVDYPVIINPSAGNTLTYTVNGKNADPLTIDEGKTVTWAVNPKVKHYHLTILFKHKKAPLADGSGKPLNAVQGSEQDQGTLKVGGKVAPGTKGHGYNYAVAVFDDDANESYSDDPKIIVGKGVDLAIDELTVARDEVKEAEQALSDRPRQLEKAQSIETDLNHLIGELESLGKY
jgi:hypothetical protein